jgi:rhamnosyltransferase subunit B
MSKFVLATSGTHGDLNPYLAMALGLQARGHRVVLVTSRSHREAVESAGLEFRPLRPDLFHIMNTSPEISARANNLRSGVEYILKQLVLPKLRETYDDLLDACDGADLLVIHSVLFSAPLVAEKLGIKWTSVLLSPGLFLSAYDPPLLPPLAWFHALRHMGPGPHRMLYRWIDRVTRRWMRPVDDLRRQVNLPPSPKNPVRDGMISPFGNLALFSPVMGAPQRDWYPKTEVTGFIYYDQVNGPPEQALLDFLEQGEPPVVFTLGTNAVTVAGEFYRVSLEVARRSGRRAVLLTGADPRNQVSTNGLPPSVFVTRYAPYSELFPRAAAVVHSGGIGTVAQTLRAGVPMIVVPHASDQPDNAQRASRLGVARVIPRSKYQPRRVLKELRRLLDDPSYRARARILGAQVRAEDGLARACDALEKHAQP